jgi:hypothetical protein
MSVRAFIRPAPATNTAPTFTIDPLAQVGDRVAIVLAQNNTNAISATAPYPGSANTTPPGDWTQRELDTTTSSTFPMLLATFTVDGTNFVPGGTYNWTLTASRAWLIFGIIEGNTETSGNWFAFASNGAAQSTMAGNMPTLNTLTALGSGFVDIYEILAIKSNGTATTSITGGPTGYVINPTPQFTSQTTFGPNLANAVKNSNAGVSGTYGGEARSGWVPNGVWNIVKTYILAFKQAPDNAAPTADAGPDQTNIEPWTTVTLDGSGSSDPDGGDSITAYAWTQTAGTAVTLSDPSSPSPTFTAPATIAGTTLTFSLVVTDENSTNSAPNTVDIQVLPVTERAIIGGVEVPARFMATYTPPALGPASYLSSVASNTPNDQNSTSLAVGLGTPVNNDLRMVVMAGTCAVGGVGADPGINTPSGWALAGKIVDSNAGTGTSSSFIYVFTKKVASGDGTTQVFSWTNPCNLVAETLLFHGQNQTTPVGSLFTAEKSTSDVNYSISGTTDVKGLLVSIFANRNSSTAWSGLPDNDAGANINTPSGPTLACRITSAELDAGTAFTKSATGTNTSIGTTAAIVIRGTD